MPNIDYSRLPKPRKPRTTGFSVKNSFYLQKTKEIPGRYKPYYEYDTSGMTLTVVGGKERPERPNLDSTT